MYTHICIYVYMYICIYACVYTCTSHICLHTCTHTYAHIDIHIHIYLNNPNNIKISIIESKDLEVWHLSTCQHYAIFSYVSRARTWLGFVIV